MSIESMPMLAEVIAGALEAPTSSPFGKEWPVSDAVWADLPGFEWARYSGPERNVQLKHYLSKRWRSASANEKLALAEWKLRKWGGIRGNREDTIRRHIALVEAEQIDAQFEGIASYSKLFSIKDPNRFAIYDARVAASLNAIQLLTDRRIFAFPIPPSRNSAIDRSDKQGFSDIYTRKHLQDNLGFTVAPRRATYRIYLRLLEDLRSLTGHPILLTEMKLFGRAVELTEAVQKKGF